MMGYWPWWAGAIALASVTVAYYGVVGRGLGVSGSWERVVHWTSERQAEKIDAAALADDDAFDAALREATLAEFGSTSETAVAVAEHSTGAEPARST